MQYLYVVDFTVWRPQLIVESNRLWSGFPLRLVDKMEMVLDKTKFYANGGNKIEDKKVCFSYRKNVLPKKNPLS